MSAFYLLVHAVSSVLLLGAVTHQALALWWPASGADHGWWRALRSVRVERYVPAVIVLFGFTALIGMINYVPFRALARAHFLDAQAPWATGLFEVKEHAAAIGLAVLPAYWAVWSEPESRNTRRAFTTLLAVITWWNFVVGHIANNIRGI